MNTCHRIAATLTTLVAAATLSLATAGTASAADTNPGLDLSLLTNSFADLQASVDAITPEITSLITSITSLAPRR